MIFHLALLPDWEAARAAGEYTVSTRGASLADVGFVHCSTAAQWRGVRERFYADVGADALVLLTIDPTGLDVRYEPPVPSSARRTDGANGFGGAAGANGFGGAAGANGFGGAAGANGFGGDAGAPVQQPASELFPHVYGPIPTDSVVTVEPLDQVRPSLPD
ncbi:DUF952 domain-containing protein [Tsukamurella serpentis]